MSKRLMSKPRLEALNASTQLKVQALIHSVRTTKTNRTRRQNLEILGFWGFGTTDQRNAFVECLCYAFRTSRIFCSSVNEQRFEGIACFKTTQIPLVEQLCNEVGMSVGVATVGDIRHGHCLACTDNMPCFFASLSRIEAGGNKTGKHPVRWGANFKDFVIQSRQKEAVLKTTGVSFDPNNMMMLYMSHHALQFSVTSQRAQFEAMRRSLRSREASSAFVSRENNRILFELQQAYSTGVINVHVFRRIAFG